MTAPKTDAINSVFRNNAGRAASNVLGFASIVNSRSPPGSIAVRINSRSRANASGVSNVGVPPPMKIVSGAGTPKIPVCSVISLRQGIKIRPRPRPYAPQRNRNRNNGISWCKMAHGHTARRSRLRPSPEWADIDLAVASPAILLHGSNSWNAFFLEPYVSTG